MTDVEFFYGAVLTSLDTLGNRTIVSKKFENYGIERTYSIRNDLKFLQSKIRIVRDSTLIVGGTYDMMTNDPEKHFRLIPYNNTLMILFHDLIGFESMFDLLSFWKNNKDSLEFIAFNQKCFTNPIGSTRFEDVYLKDARQSYIIFRSGGGDGGTSWGDLIVS